MVVSSAYHQVSCRLLVILDYKTVLFSSFTADSLKVPGALLQTKTSHLLLIQGSWSSIEDKNLHHDEDTEASSWPIESVFLV